MRLTQVSRYLPLPIAAGLIVAMMVACSDGMTTAPRKVPAAPSFSISVVGDNTGGECPNGTKTLNVTPGSGSDTNLDGVVCVKGEDNNDGKKGGGKKK